MPKLPKPADPVKVAAAQKAKEQAEKNYAKMWLDDKGNWRDYNDPGNPALWSDEEAVR